jgi:type II secretory pathway pseudopilin PulG
MKTIRNKRAFTLGEMVTTVAIIGTLMAVAVPNFTNARFQVNMERAGQTLRTIHDTMNQLLNKTGSFPISFPPGSNTAEESEITGSLTAIDQLDYEYVNYSLGAGGYRFSARPKNVAFRTGDRCFDVDPLGVLRVLCAAAFAWNGDGVAMSNVFTNLSQGWKEPWLDNNYLDDNTRAGAFAMWIEGMAYEALKECGGLCEQNGSPPPSFLLTLSESEAAAFEPNGEAIFDRLKDRGFEPFIREKDLDSIYHDLSLYDAEPYKVYEVALRQNTPEVINWSNSYTKQYEAINAFYSDYGIDPATDDDNSHMTIMIEESYAYDAGVSTE